jgi:hypothetical protein
MSTIDPVKLKEYIKLLKEAEEAEGEHAETLILRAARNLESLKNQNQQLEISIAKYREQIKTKQKIAAADESKSAAMQKEIAQIEKKIALEKAAALAYRRNQTEIDKALRKSLDTRESLQKKYSKTTGKEEERLYDIANKNMKDNTKAWSEYLNTLDDMGLATASSLWGAVEGTWANIGDLALLGTFDGLMAPLRMVEQNILRIPGEIDKSFHGVVKSIGHGSAELRKSFVYMFDPIYAASTNKAFKNLEKEARPLANIGLQTRDVGDAMTALVDDVAMFRPEFIKNNEYAATFTGNLMAGLKKLGVPLKTSAKSLNFFTKALKLTPKQANNSLKSLAKVSKSLGLSMNQVFTGFDTVAPKLAQFGDRTVEVFGNLQAMAQGTGIELGKLTGYAEKLDTFKGAATAAQQLNAVLGNTVVSVTDLVHADPADKFRIIQEAVANAGIDFETADRRMKQVIASAAGMSVPDFSKMVLNQDEAEAGADALDTTAMSQEELKQKITETMSNMELMQKNLSSLGGGFDRFLQRTRGGAQKAGDIMLKTFGGVQDQLKDSEQTAISIATMISTITGAKKELGAIGEFTLPAGFLVQEAIENTGDQSSVDTSTMTRRERDLMRSQGQYVQNMKRQSGEADGGNNVVIKPGAEVAFNVNSSVKIDAETVGTAATPFVVKNVNGQLQIGAAG